MATFKKSLQFVAGLWGYISVPHSLSTHEQVMMCVFQCDVETQSFIDVYISRSEDNTIIITYYII